MTPIKTSISLLTPYDIDRPKIRVGPNADGGYILAGPLTPEQTVLSYGISTEYRFDEELALRGHRVHMFDHTIKPLSLPQENLSFHSEGIAGVSAPGKSLFTIQDHLCKYDIEGDDLILKIDVEGAEFEALAAVAPETLRRFDQIVMEVHGLDCLADDAYRACFDAIFHKLNEQFTLFHVHANNFDGDHLAIVGGLPVAGLMELSYVKTCKVRRGANTTLYPTVMDFPCVDKKDKLLWFYPFMPTHVQEAEFSLADDRNERLSTRIDRVKASKSRDLDLGWYRKQYSDLVDYSDEFLEFHFWKHGVEEGRFGSAKELSAYENDL